MKDPARKAFIKKLEARSGIKMGIVEHRVGQHYQIVYCLFFLRNGEFFNYFWTELYKDGQSIPYRTELQKQHKYLACGYINLTNKDELDFKCSLEYQSDCFLKGYQLGYDGTCKFTYANTFAIIRNAALKTHAFKNRMPREIDSAKRYHEMHMFRLAVGKTFPREILDMIWGFLSY